MSNYKIGQLAKLTNNTVITVRHYDQAGFAFIQMQPLPRALIKKQHKKRACDGKRKTIKSDSWYYRT